MPANDMERHRIGFEAFEFDPISLELTRHARRQHLRPQSAQALALLLEHAGELVSREDLRVRLWGEETTYLDHETAINTCIRRLRAVLGDRASRPRFVMTLPGKGYRFVAPVKTITPAVEMPTEDDALAVVASVEASIAPGDGIESDGPEDGPEGARWLRSASLGLAALAAVAVIVGITTSGWMGGARTESATGPIESQSSVGISNPATLMPVVLATDFSKSGLDDQLGQALSDAFRLGVEQSLRVRILPRRRVRDALERMRLAAETVLDRDLAVDLAQREGADAVVLLRVVRLGTVFSVEMEAVASASRTTLAAGRSTADRRDGLLPALDQLVAEVGEALELAPRGDAKVLPLEQVTTADMAALRAYSVAVERREEGNLEAAIVLLNRAVEVDPDFAMAHARLGVAYRNTGRSVSAVAHFEQAEKRSERLTEFEKLYVRGWLATLRLETDKAIEMWLLVRDLYPERLTGHHNLARSFWSFRNDDSACRQVIEKAMPILGDDVERARLRGVDALCALGGNNFDAASSLDAELGAASDRGFGPSVLLVGRRYDELARRMTAWRDGELRDHGRLHSLRAMSLADQGLNLEASAMARRAELAYRGGRKVDRLYAARIASLAYLEGTKPDATLRARVERQAEDFLGLVASDPIMEPAASVPLVALFSRIAARAGATSLARRLLKRVSGQPGTGVDGFWRAHLALAEAEILAREGRLEAAVARLAPTLAETPAFPFHARDSLALWLHELGREREATALDRWLVAHRGRAFAECLGVVACFDAPLNIVAWGRANRRLSSRDAVAQ